VLGLIAVTDGLLRLSEFHSHYAVNGILPVAAVREAMSLEAGGIFRWSLMFLSASDIWQLICLVFYAACGALMVHKQTARLSSFALWVIHLSILNRAPTLNNGGDALFRILLFWNMLIAVEQWACRSTIRSRPIFSMATVGLLLQVCCVYWFTALMKSHPVWRTDFTAVQDALHLGSMQTSFGRWLAQFPLLTHWATKGTLFLEEIGPFLALAPSKFWRVRLTAVALFVAFHLVLLAPTLSIGLFPFVCVAAWIPFIPKEAWNALSGPQIGTMPLEMSEGGLNPLRSALRVTLATVATFALCYTVAWNVHSLYPDRTTAWFTPSVRAPSIALGLRQRWNLFATRPSTRDGWMLAVATLESGRVVDLLTGQPPAWNEPVEKVASHYKNWRWRKHLVGLFKTERPELSRTLHEYLIREWNADSSDHVKQMSLLFRYRDTNQLSRGILQAEIYPQWKPSSDTSERVGARTPLSQEPQEEL
jgi:hypothetical protein